MHLSPEHEWAPYSQDYACAFCGYSKPTVVKALHELVEGGRMIRIASYLYSLPKPGTLSLYQATAPRTPLNGYRDVSPERDALNWLSAR